MLRFSSVAWIGTVVKATVVGGVASAVVVDHVAETGMVDSGAQFVVDTGEVMVEGFADAIHGSAQGTVDWVGDVFAAPDDVVSDLF